MRSALATKRQVEAIERVKDAYSSARHFHSISTKLTEKTIQIETDMGNVPYYVRSYVRGYADAMTDQLYRDALVYGAWVDGTFYSTHRSRADYYETLGMSPRDFGVLPATLRGHFWADKPSCPWFAHADETEV